MKEVAALPVEKQIEAVVQKRQELNPEFEGEVTPKIEKGIVTDFRFTSDQETDISPVRSLPGLSTQGCGGRDKGRLADLFPLRGVALRNLLCARTAVSDLSPINQMGLQTAEGSSLARCKPSLPSTQWHPGCFTSLPCIAGDDPAT